MDKLRIGEKVRIPNTKSICGSIDSSVIVRQAKLQNQDFLYFAGYRDSGEIACLHYAIDGDGGDYFSPKEVFRYGCGNDVGW